MKIRTVDQLGQILSDNISWRRREMHELHSTAKSAKSHLQQALSRAGVALCYAHLEGFVKFSGTRYLEFISRLGLKQKDVTPNFIAISCFRELKNAAATKRVYLTAQLIDYLVLNREEKLKLPYENIVDTESNLNSSLFSDIIFNLGIQSEISISTEAVFIDREILKVRNSICHGEEELVEFAAFDQVHTKVNQLLYSFKAAVENSAVQKKYLLPT